jgi:hypothetical protein
MVHASGLKVARFISQYDINMPGGRRQDLRHLLRRALRPNFGVDFLRNGSNVVGNKGLESGFLPLTATPDVGVGNPFLGSGGSRNIGLSLRVSF